MNESRNLQEELKSLDGEIINEALVALNNIEELEDNQVLFRWTVLQHFLETVFKYNVL